MKKLLLLIAFVGSIFTPALSNWQKGQGPYGGIVHNMAQSENVLVATGSGNETGVYVSEDKGSTWKKIIGSDNSNSDFSKVMVRNITQKNNEDIFFLATEDHGILKLHKYQDEWLLNMFGFAFSTNSFESILYHKERIFAGIWGTALYVSSDEGKTWKTINNNLIMNTIAVLKSDGDRIYAGNTDGLYYSEDMGATWTIFNADLKGKYVTEVLFNDQNIYVSFLYENPAIYSKNGTLVLKDVKKDENDSPAMLLDIVDGKLYGSKGPRGLYYTELNKFDWQEVPEFKNLWPHCILQSEGSLLVGTAGFGVLKSPNGGLNWEDSSVGMTAFKFTAIETHGSEVYAATSVNGVFKSEDFGLSWKRINNGLEQLNQWNDLLMKDGVLYLSGQSLFVSYDKGETWEFKEHSQTFSLAANNKTVYASFFQEGIKSSDDNGKTWKKLNFNNDEKLIYKIDVRDSIILVGTHYGGPFVSLDYGVTWKQINSGLKDLAITGLVIQESTFYIATGCAEGECTKMGVFKSTDLGATWQQKNNGLCCLPTDLHFKNGILFGLFPNKILYSYDKGDNWAHIDSQFGRNSGRSSSDSELISIQTMLVNDNQLLVGTSTGLFYQSLEEFKSTNKPNITTGIKAEESKNTFKISNYPNPFSGSTTISCSLENFESNLILYVYDPKGNIIYNIAKTDLQPGTYSFNINADKMPAGIYLYKLVTNSGDFSKKMVVLK